MRHIDNFEQIRLLIQDTLQDNDKFYLIEILKRKKENPDIKKDVVIKRYYLKNVEQLDMWKADIQKLAETFNARVIFHPNIKSERRLAIEAMKALTSRFEQDDFASVHRIMDSCAASLKSAGQKYWILDVDDDPDNPELLQDVEQYLQFLNQEYNVYPTPHGHHVLVKPFNATDFKNLFPNIVIQKNHSIVLYK